MAAQEGQQAGGESKAIFQVDDDGDKNEKSSKTDIRELEDGKDKKAKVIPMKEGKAWHRGRLGKESNAELIMDVYKKGGSIATLPQGETVVKQEEQENFSINDENLSTEEKAKRALLKEAVDMKKENPEEEMTLGLTIPTGNRSSRVVSEDAALKEDLTQCGEEVKLDDYESMPISEFGMALMRGMGWKDGDALGGSRKGIIEPIEIRAQPDGLGLGAVPKEKSPERDRGSRRYIPKPGEEKDYREVERERIRKEAAERMGTLTVGTKVGIIGGRHRGMVGKISYMYAHEIMVRLEASEEEVTVDKKDLDRDISKAVEIRKQEQEKAAQREKERKEKEKQKGQREEERRHKPSGHHDRRKSDEHHHGKTEDVDWLRPHIRVRVIDKKVKAGKYYLKKATVLDVVSRGVCTIMMDDDRRMVEDVTYKMLETVLPKTGGYVLFVSGKFKGQRGKLLAKDKDREIANVQLMSSMQVEAVPMDSIAEYVGREGDMLE
ncbi:hypothetical protein GUITHDRAFT_163177 [Guillardia theta CCMP2712]|uniref:G-patch domain-containing protein n=1 Tax=Guillardia theta (strain CCMP2712) TaxID=905079 RepID=L1JBM2_GUITC|nr:hypothetical protein GUITHDRAFT_163177 [Guillardia theta CCMP2712]EKX45933.1 hypothetical protein GUITHDRAFT_163177 [Guillardia theta CCMP2712]|eukprot:XP_005832913.1 hypothetical protein GUITHDRAFT_163177 [Guillardia theta CCMP2712]